MPSSNSSSGLSLGGNHGTDQWKTMSLSTLKEHSGPRKPAAQAVRKKTAKQGLVVGGRDQHSWNTMSLSTIVPRNKNRLFKSPKQSNKTSDIPGAYVPKAYKFTNKPDYACKVDDIAGARPMRLEKTSNAISRITDCSDIEGAQPMPHGFKTDRVTDPLCPVYRLAVVKPEPMPTLKFLGDRNNIDDIQGARPAALYKYEERQSMDLSDIEGAKAGWKPRHKRRMGPPRDNIGVLDIVGGQWKTKRVTDPLNPVHVIHGITVKDHIKSRPRQLPKKRNGPNLMSTRDIPGAYPGWVPKNQREVTQVRPTNQTHDIMGAQADSCKHGIRTNRCSNPLDPMYVGVDGSMLGSIQKPNTPPAAKSSFFRDLDADGDGLVSKEEIVRMLDQDGDGKITKNELKVAIAKYGQQGVDEARLALVALSPPAARQARPAVTRLNLSTQPETNANPREAIERLQAQIDRLRMADSQQQLSQRSRCSARSTKSRSAPPSARSRSSRQGQAPDGAAQPLSARSKPMSSARSNGGRSTARSSRRESQSQKRERREVAAAKAMVAALPQTTSTSSSKLLQAGRFLLD